MPDPISRLNNALEGRYSIERELGQGGMATVYLAHDLRHERKVALKVLRPELAAVVGAERFLAEIKTTAGLQHPHILPLFDSGEADGFLFYVMPFVKGESLQERLQGEHQLPVDEAVAITVSLAEALDYAHREGVVHRDIKPANILMLEGKPVIADFGIALAVGAAGGGRLTETGLSVGTPHYMSPEQATGDQAVGPPADIYALGAVLYQLLAGEPPYSGGTAQAILGKIITSMPEPVTAQRPSVPANVDAVIRMALEKVPADRFRTAAEMAKALREPGFRHGQVEQMAGGIAHAKEWRTAAIAASVVAVASLAAAVTMSAGAREGAPRSPARTTLVTSNPSDVYVVPGAIAISRDGSEVAFTGSVGGQRALFVRSLDDPEVRRITAPGEVTAAGAIAFSPDGRSVAFTDSETRLRRVSVDGTQSVALATLERRPIGLSWSATYGPVLGMLSFSDDSNSRFLQRLDPAEAALSIVREGEGMHHGPWVLPDDESALYLDIVFENGGGRVDRLARVSLASGEREVFDLPNASLSGSSPVVGVSDGVLLYFNGANELVAMGWDDAGQRPRGSPVAVPGVPEGLVDAAMAANGTLAMLLGPSAYEVAIVDDRGNLVADVSEGPVRGGIPRFSPSGDRVAVVSNIRDVVPELWIYDARSDVISQLSLGFPAFRGFELGTVAWSPDGRTLMGTLGFVRNPLGDLRTRAADGSEAARSVFAAPGTEIFGIDLAPDGVTLAMTVVEEADPNLPSDIAVRRLDTDSTFTALTTGPTNERAPQFSPDGRWLAYASDESGVYEVYAQRFPGPGGRVQVSDAGGGQPVWSADGRRIFYQAEGAIMAAEVTADASGERMSVGARTQLFQGEFYGGAQHSATYDVHPDGDRFVVTRAAGARTNEIVVWMDWLDELKQLLAERNR